MKRDKVIDLMPDEEIALRRISYGIIGPRSEAALSGG
jgi:hypothetical protein